MSDQTNKPALVINVQTWATPIVGIVMLVAGLAAGYFGRPLLPFNGQSNTSELQPLTTEIDPATSPQPTAVVEAPTPLPQPDSAESLMELLVSQTRHFKGASDAPITLIEFSDFK
ncbi:MAG: hypothetical protein IBX69_16375 [Anaerolineales bacterium]|nr:hypothetical protein [Anaerolineales bacterium]